ncbi:ribonuclease H-like domain-containing protein [Stachybotrys elegans]|uniref:Ribonuclease H-like domain-containing protein n=1 Tax=Stachybotrys elegans TaxID=80388 RepID=A0A8K0WKK5_9HYPO|nr:ribonuclease H-like domain-containing protein [Stachybotrys elegans]
MPEDSPVLPNFPSLALILLPIQPEASRINMSPAASKKYKCAQCSKGFKAESSRKQHAQAKHAMPSLIYRNIAYSNVSVAELDTITRRLSDLCHSAQRLQKEGYSLPTGTGVQDDSRPAPRTNPPCPDRDPSAPKMAAIVLDCEMGGTVGGQDELLQITMIDFLSGNVLQSRLVSPSRPIINWRENITGITAASMQQAVAENSALHGWEAARAELWRFADKDTILLGQSVYKDLKVLHASHMRIVDSAIVTAEAVLGKKSKIRKRWSLKTLCEELLGIEIRRPSQAGGYGVHDALEDALATREVVLLCAREPDKLKRWAGVTRAAFFEKKSKQTNYRGNHGTSIRPNFMNNSNEGDEVLRWEDVVDWETWPKSPPDSD